MKPDNIKRRTAPRRPKGYCGNWERHQTVKAKELKTKIRYVRKRIDKYVKIHPEHMHLKTVLLPGITMKRYGFSIRRMVGELEYRSGSRRAACIRHVPSKSWLHMWPGRLPTDLLDDLIRFTAGEAVYGTFSVDSTHHRFNRYIPIDYTKKGNARGRKAGKNDAPEGKRRVSDTCKHHALISPNGMVPASIVTDRDTADSTIFAKLCAKLPKGRGIALGDSAYCSSDNCEAAVATGRDPFFEPRKNYTGKGTNTWAEVVRFWKEHPGRFYAVCKTRTTIEAAFSAIRQQYRVRSVAPRMQERELAIVSICRNIGA